MSCPIHHVRITNPDGDEVLAMSFPDTDVALDDDAVVNGTWLVGASFTGTGLDNTLTLVVRTAE